VIQRSAIAGQPRRVVLVVLNTYAAQRAPQSNQPAVLRGLLFLAIVVALAAVVLSLLRRTPRVPGARVDDDERDDARSATRAALPAPVAPSGLALAGDAVRRMLHELAFAGPLEPNIPAEHLKVASAAAEALQSAATDARYAPRRPMLLPQLLRAVNDSDTSRRELAHMISRDPALVGSLLKIANSSVYRRSSQPVESVERALAVLGTQGVRSLIAAALVQPVFRTTGGASGQFPETVWEHTYRSAAAAEVHAAAVEGSDLFAAQLLVLVMGLGAIVVFRVAMDQYASRQLRPDAAAVASLLDQHTAEVAQRIAASWELSDRMLDALEEQRPGQSEQAESALGRSVRFGLVAGALSVLKTNELIDDDVGLASLAEAGGSGPRFDRLWERLSWSAEDERDHG
jgi:HD-like signal output (HDOD) protein